MKDSLDVVFCNLMRVGLGLTQGFPYSLTEGEWQSLFKMAKVQTVQGVAFDALSRLPPESRPPRALSMRLSLAVEAIRGMNRRMDEVASRYTRLFAERGYRSVVLKGQANARLYPEPLSRQSGDIDIWVPGGYDKVERLLLSMGLISEGRDSYRVSHHIGFRDASGIEIEVHHRPAEVPFRNAEFQEALLAEFENSARVPEGFCVPNVRFALLMQLEHLYYHCVHEGVGLRHFMDYFVLLTHSTGADREFVRGKVRRFALGHACAAVMWVLGEVFGLSRGSMICPPDRRRGMRLYREMFAGGNFGRGSLHKGTPADVESRRDAGGKKRRDVGFKKRRPLARWFGNRAKSLSWFAFDPLNTVLREVHYWHDTISLIPERIRRRKVFL